MQKKQMQKKPIGIDEFCRLKFLSHPEFSPAGESACLVVSEADKKANDYKSYIWTYREGRLKKLTSFGAERSCQYLDEDTLLFPGKRDAAGGAGASGQDAAAAAASLESKWYRISHLLPMLLPFQICWTRNIS